jgi:hypothetical protein
MLNTDESFLLMEQNIRSKSIRYRCFRLRFLMANSPVAGYFTNFIFGFIPVLHGLVFLVMLDERMENETMFSHFWAFFSLNLLAFEWMLSPVITIILLACDVKERQCLLWHRNSLGLLVQKFYIAVTFYMAL